MRIWGLFKDTMHRDVKLILSKNYFRYTVEPQLHRVCKGAAVSVTSNFLRGEVACPNHLVLNWEFYFLTGSFTNTVHNAFINNICELNEKEKQMIYVAITNVYIFK